MTEAFYSSSDSVAGELTDPFGECGKRLHPIIPSSGSTAKALILPENTWPVLFSVSETAAAALQTNTEGSKFRAS